MPAYIRRMDARKENLVRLCEDYGIQLLYVFGSRAKEALEVLDGRRDGFSASSSDLDVGVKPVNARRLTVRDKASITVQLEELWGVSRVDLVVLPEADPFLAANIIRGERLYCADGHFADEYELYILRRAGDLAPLERERLDLLEAR